MNIQSSAFQPSSKEAKLVLTMVNISALLPGRLLGMHADFEVPIYPPQFYRFACDNVRAKKTGSEGVGKREESLLFDEAQNKEKEKEKEKEKAGESNSGGSSSDSTPPVDPGDRGQEDDQGPQSKKIASRPS
jgi:hypothetical protein